LRTRPAPHGKRAGARGCQGRSARGLFRESAFAQDLALPSHQAARRSRVRRIERSEPRVHLPPVLVGNPRELRLETMFRWTAPSERDADILARRRRPPVAGARGSCSGALLGQRRLGSFADRDGVTRAGALKGTPTLVPGREPALQAGYRARRSIPRRCLGLLEPALQAGGGCPLDSLRRATGAAGRRPCV